VILVLDFETRSELELPAVGAYKYAAHPSTEILCAAWRSSDGTSGLLVGADVDELRAEILPRHSRIVAHNVEFERQMIKEKLGTDIPIAQFTDTAALAARMSLPRKLELVAKFFKLDTGAKEEGKAAIDALCRPRKPSKDNPDKWWTPQTKPEAFEKLYARCRQDVDLTWALLTEKLMPLEDQEHELWKLTIEMNERGVLIDLPSIPLAHAILDAEAAPLEAEFDLLVGRPVKSYAKVAEALGLDNVKKPTVRKALRNPNLETWKKRALTIYQALSKSSVTKLDAMLDRADADARVRGSFMYCGADRTARWSSVGLQLQNFKRGLGPETDVAFEALKQGTLDLLFTGGARPPPDPPLNPTGTISEMLRGFILGPFMVGDFSQIEARGLAWLAEDTDQVQLFRDHGDPYCAMASAIYGFEVTKKDKEKRFMGKQAELGCGYGIGKDKFQRSLDEIYDVQVSNEFAAQVVSAYRARHPKITKFWERLNKGFVFAVANNSKRIKVTRNIFMGVITHGGMKYAFIELPSGRRLYYADPQIESSDRGPNVRYFGREEGVWTYVRTYGGKLAENITQATSRDVMAEAMLRLKAAGFKLCMTVHDEIVASAWGSKTLKDFHEIMVMPPRWCADLPIEVESFDSIRYRK
jgi:DNA polymerase